MRHIKIVESNPAIKLCKTRFLEWVKLGPYVNTKTIQKRQIFQQNCGKKYSKF